ncbi:T9SS type A sorting domain-containing protein [Flavobacterium zepuense]|uniref:T9SS type A sorting domain-containing protein n=1 Tax=Flavobacterium zepuense TaxID=2593302 RepID=A0A552UYQ2_9FLAO|nr:RICIN domain-containing protein [Flavobacterium zepuense]TRW23354.1 T9SS type A sorting domain-containing protein [Flavobacterium zepuense]
MKKQQPTSGFKANFYNLSFFLLLFCTSYAQTVTPWITSGDQSKLIQQQATVSFAANSGTNASTITVTPGTTYQTIDGFGWTLTEGSAEVINSLAATQQNNLLQELFNPSTGLSSNVVRISIAASDLSSYSYSYNESSGDTNMNNFSLNGPDLTYLIPILKKVLAINPNIKILATPWSAPRWMKTNNSWVGGSLQTNYYSAYARYFVKYFQAMQAQGINIWGITPQNEPENPYNEPSMTMNSAQQKDFINNHLGPQMSAAGFGGIKIIAFDHNCDNTAYPIDVLNNSGYVDGAAFHLYSGNISAMTTVKNATGKNVYFTEQWVGGPGSFSGDFGWHMQNVILGSVNNWAKVALEWNLANNPQYGPRTPGGCTTCLGAITVNNSTSYTRNSPYYIIGQISKFVKNGAVRIGSSSTNGSITTSAFKNTDGSTVLVIYNAGGSNTVKVVQGGNAFNYTVPASSAVSFKWTDNTTPPPSGFPGYYNIVSRLSAKGLDVANNATTSGSPIQQWELTNGGGSNQRWRFENAGNGQYYIRVKSTGMYLALASASTADGIKVQQRSFTNDNTSKWTVASVGDGYYRIDNVYSGKALDVTDVSTANGALIQVWAYGGGTNQQWQLNQVESTAKMGQPDKDTNEITDSTVMVKSLSVFPNPASNTVTLTSGEAGTYTLIGLTGNIISTGKVTEGENTIDIENLSAGYYLIRYENSNGGIRTLKLLKE